MPRLTYWEEVSPSSLQHVKEFLGDLAKSGLKVERQFLLTRDWVLS
ncbi:MAG: hypothetical protein IJS36_01825 [Kiritimatiellae bacterium]|nr:hypothetical protein [Kiritimatiellia bacterium]